MKVFVAGVLRATLERIVEQPGSEIRIGHAGGLERSSIAKSSPQFHTGHSLGSKSSRNVRSSKNLNARL